MGNREGIESQATRLACSTALKSIGLNWKSNESRKLHKACQEFAQGLSIIAQVPLEKRMKYLHMLNSSLRGNIYRIISGLSADIFLSIFQTQKDRIDEKIWLALMKRCKKR